MGRTPCCEKANVKRGPWSPEEDAKLKDFIEKYGTGGNWISLPQKAGLKRCGKSCRLRWLNYLRPNIKHGDFSVEEDRIICRLFNQIRSKWSVIAAHLPGRTDNDIKNYWNTKLKKKYVATINNNNHINSLSSQIFTQTPTPLLDDPSLQFYSDFYANSSINMTNYLSPQNTQQPQQTNIWNNILPQTHLIQTTENGQWNFTMHPQYQASSESSENLSQITQDHNVVTVAATGNANVLNYAASSTPNVVGNTSGGFEENYQSVLMMLQQQQQKGRDIGGGHVNGYGHMANVVSNNPQFMQCNYDDDVHEEVSYYY